MSSTHISLPFVGWKFELIIIGYNRSLQPVEIERRHLVLIRKRCFPCLVYVPTPSSLFIGAGHQIDRIV
jgi:hypothetical protein